MLKRMTRLVMVVTFTLAGLGLTLSSLSATGNAAEECVSPGGVGGCFATIQSALDAVDAGGTVRVMAGDYVENLVIDADVTLVGGFDDATFSSRTSRSSILDGNRAGPVIKVISAANATIDGFTVTGGDATSDTGQGGGIFVFKAAATIVDNLIEENVANSSETNDEGVGGGIAVVEGIGEVTIRDNTIRTNLAYSVSATSPVTFGIGIGGGIGLVEDESTTIIGNHISDNRAAKTNIVMPVIGWGGGIGSYASDRIAIMGNNVIEGNIGNETGGNGHGGGVNLYHVGYATITNNEIVRNTAALSGGFSWGGGIFIRVVHTATLTNNYIAENVANTSGHDGQGGGVLINSSPRGSGQVMTMIGNQIIDNVANMDAAAAPGHERPFVSGGGVRVWGGDAEDEHLIVRDNQITGNIAARSLTLFEVDDNGYAQGGGLTVERISHTEVISNEVANNVALLKGTVDDDGEASGGGMHLRDNETVLVSENRVTGNTSVKEFAGSRRFSIHGGGLFIANTKHVSITHNMVANNTGLRSGDYENLEEIPFLSGGGLFVTCWSIPDCLTTVEKNRFSGNILVRSATISAEPHPQFLGGGLSLNNGTFLVNENWIEGNNSYLTGDFDSDGGAIYCASCQATLERNTLRDNDTGRDEDARPVIWVWNGQLVSRNNLFVHNSGVAAASGPSGGQRAQLTFINDTIVGKGGTAFNGRDNSSVSISNTIIVGHEIAMQAPDPSTAMNGDYNLLLNETNYGSGVTPGLHDVTGLAPGFVGDDDYHLLGGSPAIDAGDNSVAPEDDFDKDERPIDGNLDGDARTDIGADEFVPASIYLPAIFAE